MSAWASYLPSCDEACHQDALSFVNRHRFWMGKALGWKSLLLEESKDVRVALGASDRTN